MLKIALTDDHTIFRKSLALLINTFSDMEVVVQASNGNDLLAQLSAIAVDIVLLDLQMPVMDGFVTCQELHRLYPDLKILILSHLDSIENISRVMELGVDGYFTKSADPGELQLALQKLTASGFYFEKSLSEVITQILQNGKSAHRKKNATIITEREKQVIIMAAQELSGKEIADRLNISLRTVEVHKKNIMIKTQSKNFIGVILYAISHQEISISDFKSANCN